MKNKKLYMLIILIVLALFLFFNMKDSTTTAENSKGSKDLADFKELTLRQAIELAEKDALKWNPKAKISFVGSVDNPETEKETDGSNGKRRYWNFEFMDPKTEKHMGLTIHDGKIINKRYTQESGNIFNIPNNSFDSTNALKIAKSQFNLKPGKGWAGGYHFEINNLDNNTVLTVVGRDNNGNFAKVYFNIDTGKVVSAERKKPIGGGLFIENSNKPLFYDKDLSLVGSSFSPNFTEDKTIFIWGYHNISNTLFIKVSRNGGSSWSNVTIPSTSVQKIGFSENYNKDHTIYIITANSILKSNNDGFSWSEVLKTKAEIKNTFLRSNKFSVLTEKNILLTENYGKTWTTNSLPEVSYFTFINSQGEFLLVTDRKIYTLKSGKWVEMALPLENVVGAPKMLDDKLIINSINKIGIFNEMSSKWDVIETPYPIENVWLIETSDKSQLLYVLTKTGKLYRGNQGGDMHEIVNSSEGYITKILGSREKGVYFVVTPEFEWEKMERSELKT